MKSQKNNLKKVIAVLLVVLSLSITGCGKKNEEVDSTQMYAEHNEKLSINWDEIISNLKDCDIEGFYFDKETFEDVGYPSSRFGYRACPWQLHARKEG